MHEPHEGAPPALPSPLTRSADADLRKSRPVPPCAQNSQLLDGAPGTGKAFGLYNVQYVPTIYLLDEAGVIRATGELRGQRLDDLVEKLVKALEAKTARVGG